MSCYFTVIIVSSLLAVVVLPNYTTMTCTGLNSFLCSVWLSHCVLLDASVLALRCPQCGSSMLVNLVFAFTAPKSLIA